MRAHGMNDSSNAIKKALDAAAIGVLAFVCFSGVVVHGARMPIAPSMFPSSSGLVPILFGLSQPEWVSINDGASLLFLVLLLPNLFWGRSSLRWMIRRGPADGSFARAALGIIASATLIALLIVAVRGEDNAGADIPEAAVPLLGDQSDGKLLALSLDQLELRTGVPAEYLRTNLGLPQGVSTSEPLGDFADRYRVTPESIRGVIFMHRATKTLPIPSDTTPAPTHFH